LEVKRYRQARELFRQIFGQRVQKISIDAGFTCPNRDGTRGWGGCTYCLNSTFTPYYVTRRKSIVQQLNEGIAFFSKKYKTWKYLAYFQAYTNTYAPLHVLKQKYEQALSVPGVIGLVISTRPDAVNEQILDYLAQLNERTFVLLEYGVESTFDTTLERVNRGHTFEEAAWAIEQTAKRGILQTAHLILGLPGETPEQMLQHATRISQLPVNILKLHQLQIIKRTAMQKDFEQNPQDFHLFSVDEYVDFVVDFLERLRPDIYIDRFTNEAPRDLVIAPDWGGLKNFEVTHKIERRLQERKTWQGRLWKP
jgi:radical SAM protein (TIGR01212 family)